MKKINVYWDVNITRDRESISLEELGVDTMEEWRSLEETEQRERLQTAIDELPERTCIIVDFWEKD